MKTMIQKYALRASLTKSGAKTCHQEKLSAVFQSRNCSSVLSVSKTVKTRKLIAKVVTSKTVSPSQERNSLSWKNICGWRGF